MRKLKLQVQITVDGFIAGPNGEMDWLAMPWTKDIENYVTELLAPVDTIVLGRKLAEGFIPYWASVAADKANPEVTAGEKFTDTPKVVFTKTLSETDPAVANWTNTHLAKGDLVEEITQLKKQNGKDLYACGGATFVSSLIKHNLIDEYHLFVNPTAIGNGMAIFKELPGNRKLKLVRSVPFDCGIVVMHYEPVHD